MNFQDTRKTLKFPSFNFIIKNASSQIFFKLDFIIHDDSFLDFAGEINMLSFHNTK